MSTTDKLAGSIAHEVRDPVAAAWLEPVPSSGRQLSRNREVHRSVTDHGHAALLACTDFFAASLAIPLALVLLANVSTVPSNSLRYFGIDVLRTSPFPAAVVIALAVSGSYRSAYRALQPSTFGELKNIVFAIGAACVLLLAAGAIVHDWLGTGEYNTTQLLTDVVAASVTVPLARSALRTRMRTNAETNVIVVGSGGVAERVQLHLRLLRGFNVVGRVTDTLQVEAGAIGTVSDLPEICDDLDVDQVVIGTEGPPDERSLAVYRTLQGRVHISAVPQHYQLISWRTWPSELLGLPLLEFAPPHHSVWDRAFKRAFDVTVSSIALVALVPVVGAIALAVRLTSPGPALFRQERLGRDRKPFVIYKFRTMTDVAPQRPGTALSEEPSREAAQTAGTALWQSRRKVDERHRVTPLGGFLRRTGLDELPQLFNVLGGSMSIVGPRPFVRHEAEVPDDWSARRFEVPPGITGLWQVSGRNELDGDALRQLDYLYVVSWSMSWDLKIIFDTPRAMLRGLGAY